MIAKSFKFTPKEINTCTKFAEASDISYYLEYGQRTVEKIRKDIVTGKLGEIAVYNYLAPKFPDLCYPDFQILSKKEKSYDYDLKCKNYNFHVKSQNKNMIKKFGESWAFQAEDTHVFKHPLAQDYCAFVTLDMDSYVGYIKYLVPVFSLREHNLFEVSPTFTEATNKLFVSGQKMKDLFPERLYL